MFSKKTVCFITGSSRGLGESIALNLAQQFPPSSVIVLLARSEGDLQKVKARLLEKSPQTIAVVHQFDQSTQDPKAFEAVFSQALQSAGVKVSDFQQAILVNNAGSAKPTVYIRNLPDVKELTEYLSINVSGVISLTSEFLKAFPASLGVSRVVINISSIAAVQPFKSWAMYCSGKVARDMFFKILAEEEKDIRVLNYAPGPLQTEMLDYVTNRSEDDGVRNWFSSSKDRVLTCDQSVTKLIQLLKKDLFESGIHFDYYDEL